MCMLLGLRQGDGRSGVDAFLDFTADGKRYSAPLELKSTTGGSVSTARDVGPTHIEKWRSLVWVFGFYDHSGGEIEHLLALGPPEMEPWIGRVESYIAPDFAIGKQAALRLTLEDMHIVCGEKSVYSIDDAKALHKRQWGNSRYEQEKDLVSGYSPQKMLEILKQRSEYLHHRGATLNNPHIPRGFFRQVKAHMVDVKASSATRTKRVVRAQIRASVLAHPEMRAQARVLRQH